MSKTYKGYELIKEIAEGNIKDRTRFKNSKGIIYIFINSEGTLQNESSSLDIDDDYCITQLAKETFEIVEDEIDIQEIKEFRSEYTMNMVEILIKDKLNEVIKGMKQLDNKINNT